jgi:hypothetical protein
MPRTDLTGQRLLYYTTDWTGHFTGLAGQNNACQGLT